MATGKLVYQIPYTRWLVQFLNEKSFKFEVVALRRIPMSTVINNAPQDTILLYPAKWSNNRFEKLASAFYLTMNNKVVIKSIRVIADGWLSIGGEINGVYQTTNVCLQEETDVKFLELSLAYSFITMKLQ